jgi:hypothetical protein
MSTGLHYRCINVCCRNDDESGVPINFFESILYHQIHMYYGYSDYTTYTHNIEKKSWVYGVYVVYPMGTPLDDKRGGDGAFASAVGANNQCRVYHLSHLWSCSVVGQQNRRRTIFGWCVGSLLRFTRTTIATRRCYFDI